MLGTRDTQKCCRGRVELAAVRTHCFRSWREFIIPLILYQRSLFLLPVPDIPSLPPSPPRLVLRFGYRWLRFQVVRRQHHHPDDAGSKHLWNIGVRPPRYKALHPRRQPCPDSFLICWIHSVGVNCAPCTPDVSCGRRLVNWYGLCGNDVSVNLPRRCLVRFTLWRSPAFCCALPLTSWSAGCVPPATHRLRGSRRPCPRILC
jgi:hypothetical protein